MYICKGYLYQPAKIYATKMVYSNINILIFQTGIVDNEDYLFILKICLENG